MKKPCKPIPWARLLELAQEQNLHHVQEQVALGLLAMKIRGSLFEGQKENFLETNDFETLSLALGYRPEKLRKGIESLLKTIF